VTRPSTATIPSFLAFITIGFISASLISVTKANCEISTIALAKISISALAKEFIAEITNIAKKISK